jgi:hypothetical protein
MAKVIVERPRLGGAAHTFRERRNELKAELNRAIRSDNYDQLHFRESYRHWASYGLGYDRKELNENLNPLRRYLRSQVGRVWDVVFSEMCEVMDPRDACQFHIWQHAKDDVETRTFIGDDGKVWFADDYCWHVGRDGKGVDRDWHRPIEDSSAEIYVDPRNGTVQLVPQRNRYRYRRPQLDYVKIDKWRQAHKIGEHWFLVELAPIPQPYWKPWTETEKARIQAEIKMDRAARYGSWFSYNSEKADYKRSSVGRWIYPTVRDVAYGAILATWRNAYERTGKQSYVFDRLNAKDVYGRGGVYAWKRKQMNTAELRRWVYPKFPPLVEEPEIAA